MMNRFNLHFSPEDDENKGGGDPPEKDALPDGAPDWVAPRLSKLSQAKNDATSRADKAEAALRAITDKQETDKLKKLEEDGELKQVNEALTAKVTALEPFKAKYEELEKGQHTAAMEKIVEAIGEDDAKAYEDFDTVKLQIVAQTIGKKADAPAPNSDKGGTRNSDASVQAALKKHGSKANIAKADPGLYNKLFPNPKRRGYRA